MLKNKKNICLSFFILFLLFCYIKFLPYASGGENTGILKYIGILKDPNESVESKESAKLNLLRTFNWMKLNAFSTELIEALTDYKTSEESCILLGLITLPENLIQELLMSDITSAKVKARLGDKRAETTVIRAFKDSSDIGGKRKYSNDLLYMGTETALKAFAEALESEEFYIDYRGNKISLAQMMITSYSELHPEVELFSVNENRKHFFISGTEFLRQEHQEYLRKIEQYFKDNYQIEIHMNPPFLLHEDYTFETYDEVIK